MPRRVICDVVSSRDQATVADKEVAGVCWYEYKPSPDEWSIIAELLQFATSPDGPFRAVYVRGNLTIEWYR
jgi:hypothetical protein